MMPVLLWTDGLVWLLLVALAAAIPLARRNPQTLRQWRRVFASRLGMAAAIVMAVYLAVALLDSLHFRPALAPIAGAEPGEGIHYSPRVLSILDLAFGELREPTERSYSRPFAAFAFSKESLPGPEGALIHAYPRLGYGGRHLDDPARQLVADVLEKSLAALSLGLGGTLALLAFLATAGWLPHRRRQSWRAHLAGLWRKESGLPWRTALFTSLAVCLTLAWLYQLSRFYHVLGTDKVGYDVLYLTVKSIRTGVLIGLLTTLVMLPLAISLGVSAGYFGGLIDDVIQYLYTTLNSIPGVLLIAAAVLILQVYMNNHPELFETEAARSDLRLLFLCIILGVTSWTGLCRMLRAETLKLRSLDYVEAARAFGVGNAKLLARHILPNVTHLVLISVALDFSGLVLAEAVLSYVGVGVDPSTPSWGNMINSARLELAREPAVWWPLAAAFVFMFILVLAANLYADVVRDAFDPHVARKDR